MHPVKQVVTKLGYRAFLRAVSTKKCHLQGGIFFGIVMPTKRSFKDTVSNSSVSEPNVKSITHFPVCISMLIACYISFKQPSSVTFIGS